MKVYVLLDHDDSVPSFVRITEAKVHGNSVVEDVELKPGQKSPMFWGDCRGGPGVPGLQALSLLDEAGSSLRHEDE